MRRVFLARVPSAQLRLVPLIVVVGLGSKMGTAHGCATWREQATQ